MLCLALSASAHASCDRTAKTSEVDRILIEKAKRRLRVLRADGSKMCEFSVALGKHPKGPKRKVGDGKTPEGEYSVQMKRDIGHTRFYRGFYLSYPNAEDRRTAAAAGVKPGGDILIHGLEDKYRRFGRLHRLKDWTNGCIAVTDEEMDEMRPLISEGTTVVIRP